MPFDKKAYQRAYMARKRAEKKLAKLATPQSNTLLLDSANRVAPVQRSVQVSMIKVHWDKVPSWIRVRLESLGAIEYT